MDAPGAEAGGLPNPTLLRTFEALKKTLVHLRGLMGRVGDGSNGTCTLLEAHRFLWDRYRSIRKDITQTELIHQVGDTQANMHNRNHEQVWALGADCQRLPVDQPTVFPWMICSLSHSLASLVGGDSDHDWAACFDGLCVLAAQGDNQLRWVIAANEEMARFMLLADAFLADKDKVREGGINGCARPLQGVSAAVASCNAFIINHLLFAKSGASQEFHCTCAAFSISCTAALAASCRPLLALLVPQSQRLCVAIGSKDMADQGSEANSFVQHVYQC